jgi:D-alanyl-D-alanine carboxypeptidase
MRFRNSRQMSHRQFRQETYHRPVMRKLRAIGAVVLAICVSCAGGSKQAPQPNVAEVQKPAQEGSGSAEAALKVGDVVFGQWTDGNWYLGKIAASNSDGTYAVNYDDGDVSPSLSASQVRRLTSESIAGQKFGDWLKAFNAGDRGAIEANLNQLFATDAKWPPLDAQMGFREETGGFEVIKIEGTTTTMYAALVKERESDQYARAMLEVDAAPPNRIRRFDIRAIPTPDEYMPARLGEAEALKAMRAELEKQVASDAFSGAVIVAKNGKAIYAEAYGFADRDKKVANTLDTRFRIGSMNKMFTAVTMLRLVQTGKVKLDDPLGKYLKNYPNQDVATKVTLHHLLSHTGGTGDIFGPDFDKHRLELRTHEDYLKLYGARGLDHEPGTAFRYSNYGFVLAGAIIEKVTGKTYYDAVAATVFKPAKMIGTASPPEDSRATGRSIGYMRESHKTVWRSNVDTLPHRGTAAGGGDSTVKDLLEFANALTANQLLDAKHFELLTTSKMGPGMPQHYGYGMSLETSRTVKCFGHGGGAPGMNGQLTVCDSGYTVVVLANMDPPAAGRIAHFVSMRLPLKAE